MDTNAELADMHLAYGAANCSGPAAQRLYAERYPMRRIPSHNFFARLHQRLAETGSFERADMVRRLEDSPRTRHASVSRAACPDTATGRLCTSCCFRTVVPWKMCYESPFPDEVLFSDEASFTREGIFNTHNDHIWAVENPHAIRRRAAQIRFSVNVWAGIIGDHLIGPYLFPCRLTGLNYLLFLQQVLPQLLRDEQISASTQQTMWFQHDGAPCPF
ncbi:DUF4817 domain-containing protein [Trichonephila clavipes]|nr:DUF4817 domain-containing protein [Trichonephila clavipes]